MRVDDHRGDAQPVGHPTGMLAAGAAEADQRVRGDVVAALGADLADRVGHVLHCDLAEPERHLGCASMGAGGCDDLVGQPLDADHSCFDIEGLVAAGAEHGREELRADDAQHHVGIGDRKRAAAPVARRAGAGTRRFGAHAQPAAVEREQRTAARSNGVHVDDRRADANARHLGLVGALELAREVRHVGRGTAHVEPDQPFEASSLSRPRHAHHAPRRPRQQRIAPREPPGIRQAPVRLHELQLRPARRASSPDA